MALEKVDSVLNQTINENSTIDPKKLGRVAVLMGGTSAERDISLISGSAILDGLVEAGVDAYAIDIGADPIKQLMESEMDRAFVALHGPGGEDGKIQAVLGFLNIPFTGSGVMASAIAMDKLRTKYIWQALGLPTPAFIAPQNGEIPTNVFEALGDKVVVKPSIEGSSIGIAVADSWQTLRAAYEQAQVYDESVIIESFIDGDEYSVSILEDAALPAIKLETDRGFYDFQAKYIDGETRYLCPCGLPDDKESELRNLATNAFNALGATGWGRVDVMADKKGNFYLLEVNTVPGMTSHSLVPKSARQVGYSFSDLVKKICELTL